MINEWAYEVSKFEWRRKNWLSKEYGRESKNLIFNGYDLSIKYHIRLGKHEYLNR